MPSAVSDRWEQEREQRRYVTVRYADSVARIIMMSLVCAVFSLDMAVAAGRARCAGLLFLFACVAAVRVSHHNGASTIFMQAACSRFERREKSGYRSQRTMEPHVQWVNVPVGYVPRQFDPQCYSMQTSDRLRAVLVLDREGDRVRSLRGPLLHRHHFFMVCATRNTTVPWYDWPDCAASYTI